MTNICISGMTGSGKSYYFSEVILKELNRKKCINVVMLDTKGQHHLTAESVADGTSRNIFKSWKIVAARNRKKERFRIRIVPGRGMDKGQRLDLMESAAKYASAKGHCYFIIEEYNWYSPSKWVVPPYFDDLLRLDTGDHNRSISVVLISQFPSDLPKDVMGAMKKQIIFKQREKVMKACVQAGHFDREYQFLPTEQVYPNGYVGQFYAQPSRNPLPSGEEKQSD